MNKMKEYFDILEISQDSTYDEAKAAYRLMAQVWHPDKYTHNENLHAKATEKFKQINAAWSEIDAYFKSRSTYSEASRPDGQTEQKREHEEQKSEDNEERIKTGSSARDSKSPAEDINLYRVFIGKNFDKYYSEVIKLLQHINNGSISWHWPAFFVGTLWAFYRKMYKIGCLLLFIDFIFRILFSEIDNSNGVFFLFVFAYIGVKVIFAYYAKTLYVKHVKSKIITYNHLDNNSLLSKLESTGGTNIWFPLLFTGVPILAVVVVIFLPQLFSSSENTHSNIAPISSTSVQENQTTSSPTNVTPPPSQEWVAIDSSAKNISAAPVPKSEFVIPPPPEGYTIDSPVDPKSSSGISRLNSKLCSQSISGNIVGPMWAANGNLPGRQMTYEEAMAWVSDLNYAGYKYWRLPTKDELVKLSKAGKRRSSDWLNSHGFDDIQSKEYWTSSICAHDAKGSVEPCSVNLRDGQISADSVNRAFYVLPVHDWQ